MKIQNTTWTSPFIIENMIVFSALALFTLAVEVTFVYFYAKSKRYEDIGLLLAIVVGSNLITGFIGFAISVMFWVIT